MSPRLLPLAALMLAACTADAVVPLRTPPSGAPSMAVVAPTPFPGNTSGDGNAVCATARVNPTGAAWFGFKVDPPVSASVGGISAVVGPATHLSWSASADYLVQAVVVKGGSGENVYTYSGGSSGDSGLVSPLNNGGNVPDISHYVVCYTVRLSVTKTAATSFDREFAWTVAKTADPTALTLAASETFPVGYLVTVGASHTDQNFAVTGEIRVSNPAPVAASLTGVTDLLSSGEAAPVSCPMPLPYSMAPGETVTCSYATSLPSGAGRTNTASASSGTPGVADGSGSAPVSFGGPSRVIDGCVALSDTYAASGLPASVCSGQLSGGVKSFAYTRVVGPFGTGTHTVTNTASILSGDQNLGSSATADVVVTVPGTGCTLTQGYWKNHADGSRHYNPTWAGVGGSGTVFFLSGQSWLAVFGTPVKGNVYYQLAHQYMAARLNVAAGAGTPSAVSAALASGTAFFGSVTPTTKLTTAQRTSAQAWATTLGQYNEGAIGPGHCSE